MDAVLSAYKDHPPRRDRYLRTEGCANDAILQDLHVLVNREYHRPKTYRGRELPRLRRFDVKARHGIHYIRATHGDECLMSDARRSPPLPSEETPASVFRQQKQKDLLTDTCFVCHEGFSLSITQSASIYTTCCVQPCHFGCLAECMQHGPSCPMCREPFYNTPSTTPVDSRVTAEAGFGLARQASDFD